MVDADKWEADDLAARVEPRRGVPCARNFSPDENGHKRYYNIENKNGRFEIFLYFNN
jgi:hypothetical protein